MELTVLRSAIQPLLHRLLTKLQNALREWHRWGLR